MSVVWDESLSTGVRVLDEQHQDLFRYFDWLLSATREQRVLRTAYALTQLEHYARDHFDAEERLMRSGGFPGLESHRFEHRQFAEQMTRFRRHFQSQDISEELTQFLASWLERHVRTSDMAYVRYFSAHPSGCALNEAA